MAKHRGGARRFTMTPLITACLRTFFLSCVFRLDIEWDNQPLCIRQDCALLRTVPFMRLSWEFRRIRIIKENAVVSEEWIYWPAPGRRFAGRLLLLRFRRRPAC
jgi:hypothetical protein